MIGKSIAQLLFVLISLPVSDIRVLLFHILFEGNNSDTAQLVLTNPYIQQMLQDPSSGMNPQPNLIACTGP